MQNPAAPKVPRGFAILLAMEPNLKNTLEEQSAKLDAIYESVEKTRKYFLMVMWISILMVALPFIGLLFIIPTFIQTYRSFEGLL